MFVFFIFGGMEDQKNASCWKQKQLKTQTLQSFLAKYLQKNILVAKSLFKLIL